jgi:hypothetical protein
MATLNVQDYGAVGDGSHDDTDAINDALSDSRPGDDVVFPYTEDSYLVYSSSREAVGFQRCADDVTVRGVIGPDGEGPVIKMGDVPTGNVANKWTAGIDAGSASAVTGLAIEQLTFSGNRAVNRDLNGYNVAAFNIYDGGSGWDITIRNCIFEEAGGKGLSTAGGISRVTIENVTCRNNDRHGFNPNGSGAGSTSNPDVYAKNLLLIDNGYKGGGTGMDVSGGYIEIENVYADRNVQGYKIGDSGGQPKYFRLADANLRDSQVNSGWRETGGGDTAMSGTTIEFDTVQFIGTWLDGVRCGDAATYEITELLVDGANKEGSNRWGFRPTDTADVTADTLRIQNTTGNEGIRNESDGRVSVGTYYHHGNDGGPAVDASGTLSIDSQVNQQSSELDVPAPGDVGAFVDSGETKTEPQTYQTVFGEYDTDAAPADWTPRWTSAGDDWSVVTDANGLGGQKLASDGTTSDRHALSWDAIGTAADVEVLGYLSVSDLSQDITSGGRLHIRGGGSDGDESSYLFNVRAGAFGIWKYTSTGSEKLVEWGTPAEQTEYATRFQANGHTLKARVWQLGDPEPETWDVETTDSQIRSGWVGVGTYSEYTDFWDAITVGVGGASAPTPDLSSGISTPEGVIQTSSGALIAVDGTVVTDGSGP